MMIASLVISRQSIEYIKDKYKASEKQINSYVKKYEQDVSLLDYSVNAITTNKEENQYEI